MRYMVELRSYSEDGDDYSEDHYAFETREDEGELMCRKRNSKGAWNDC